LGMRRLVPEERNQGTLLRRLPPVGTNRDQYFA
jgi:hypothetical protein